MNVLSFGLTSDFLFQIVVRYFHLCHQTLTQDPFSKLTYHQTCPGSVPAAEYSFYWIEPDVKGRGYTVVGENAWLQGWSWIDFILFFLGFFVQLSSRLFLIADDLLSFLNNKDGTMTLAISSLVCYFFIWISEIMKYNPYYNKHNFLLFNLYLI